MKSTLDLLLKRGADPNASAVPMPVLFFAIKSADVEVVKKLLMKGASTAITLPKEVGNMSVYSHMLKKLGSVSRKYIFFMPLAWKVRWGHLVIGSSVYL